MAYYAPLVGIITNIETIQTNAGQTNPCTLLLTLEGEEPSGIFQIQLTPNTYVMNLYPFQVGDRATFFYDPNAPMVLIYPPRYTAVAGAYTPHGTSAMMDVFLENLHSSDHSLMLNLSRKTPITTANGQPYNGNPAGHLLLVYYSMTTRSIPPQTSPDQVIVFCQKQ